MATDSYMAFKKYDGSLLAAESQVVLTDDSSPIGSDTSFIDLKGAAKNGNLFEVLDYSFDIEQTLNIGSQSSGAGAGKVTFNPFSISRKIDKATPTFFQMSCAGQTFSHVSLGLRKSSGTATSGSFFLRFDFKLVAVKTMSWSHGDESPTETVTFEYGGMAIRYSAQDASGKMAAPIVGGWNKVTNVVDVSATKIGS